MLPRFFLLTSPAASTCPWRPAHSPPIGDSCSKVGPIAPPKPPGRPWSGPGPRRTGPSWRPAGRKGPICLISARSGEKRRAQSPSKGRFSVPATSSTPEFGPIRAPSVLLPAAAVRISPPDQVPPCRGRRDPDIEQLAGGEIGPSSPGTHLFSLPDRFSDPRKRPSEAPGRFLTAQTTSEGEKRAGRPGSARRRGHSHVALGGFGPFCRHPGPQASTWLPLHPRKGPAAALRSGSGGKRGRQMPSKRVSHPPATSSTWKNGPIPAFRGRFPSSRPAPASTWRSSGGPKLSQLPIGRIGSAKDSGQIPPLDGGVGRTASGRVPVRLPVRVQWGVRVRVQ